MNPGRPADEVLEAARELAAGFGGEAAAGVRTVQTLSGTWIALGARTVVKVHAAGSDGADLAARLALAAEPALSDCVVAPLIGVPVPLGQGIGPHAVLGTVWPRVDPLPQDVAAAPWREAGALLARLHRVPMPAPGAAAPLPVQGSVARVRAALARLAQVTADRTPPALGPAMDVVRAAADHLPPECWSADGAPGRPRGVVHGDWHLGQLGRLRDVPVGPARTGSDGWRLIDVDDLGHGDPAWDLGRPAAFWAAGLMPDADWWAFVESYRAAGGPAVPPPPADPWPALDAVARACVVLAAAGAVRRAAQRGGHLEDVDVRMVEICAGLPRS